MKNANFYLSFLSLAVIGFSGYTIYGMFRQPLVTSTPQVLGETNSPLPPQATDKCQTGLIGITYDTDTPCSINTNGSPQKPTSSPNSPTPRPPQYANASYVCADGTKGNVIEKVGKCVEEPKLKDLAVKACQDRSSCAPKSYIPCAEFQPFLSLIKCPSFLPQQASAPCALINQITQKYCSNFIPTPKPTKATKPTDIPKAKSCNVGVWMFSPSVDKTCPSGQYRKARYTCYGAVTGALKSIGSATSECKALNTLKKEASAACDPVGTCPDKKICGPDKKCAL